jgi:uncharacterized protein (TIGR02453 family)
MPDRSFTPSLFTFLEDLADHNDREWFKQQKGRYVEFVQEPAVAFILEVAPGLGRISPHLRADARPVGGSLFRIQRDTRFSKDKTPYKIHTGIQFRHASGADVHAPGFYLHLQPGEVFAAAGIWRPEGEAARRIRRAIVDDPTGWKRAAHGKGFATRYVLTGDVLKRPPTGFPSDGPFADDLMRKDFIAEVKLSEKAATAPGFAREYVDLCRAAAPFMRFLCRALDLPF